MQNIVQMTYVSSNYFQKYHSRLMLKRAVNLGHYVYVSFKSVKLAHLT